MNLIKFFIGWFFMLVAFMVFLVIVTLIVPFEFIRAFIYGIIKNKPLPRNSFLIFNFGKTTNPIDNFMNKMADWAKID